MPHSGPRRPRPGEWPATAVTGSLPNHQHPGRCGAASATITVTVTVSVCGGAQAIPDSVIQRVQAQGLAGRIVVSSSVSLAGRGPAETTAGQHPVTRPGATGGTYEADRLAEIHDRLAAAPGTLAGGRAASQRGIAADGRPPLPYERALLELADGQVLRRSGQRRAADSRLRAAREQLSTLDARPDLERCDRELAACGLTPAKRSEIDPTRLTAQESAVAELVATGMGNREVATELFVSIKTVQFHLTHIYAKLGIHSRSELAALFRQQAIPGTDEEQRSKPGQRSLSPGKAPRRADARVDPSSASVWTQVQQPPRRTTHPLTPQESAVAGLVATGMTNREVATELFVCIKTVQFHLTRIYAKLGVHSRAELAAQFGDRHVSRTGVADR